MELIPHNRINVYVGVAVHLPPICYRSKELVHGKKKLLTIRALGDHELPPYSLEPILGFHGTLRLRESSGASSQKLSQMRLVWWWRWGCLLLVSVLVRLHVVEGL
jgi:hypothetical protein